VPFLLAERAHSESARSMRAVKGNLDHSLEQMFGAEEERSPRVSCARATRGLRRPSHGLMVRLGGPVGGRVRK
jgi:hypothetical protein